MSPGIFIIPTALNILKHGARAADAVDSSILFVASVVLAPYTQAASIVGRCVAIWPHSVDEASVVAVRVLPHNIPAIGIQVCALYQGYTFKMPSRPVSAITQTPLETSETAKCHHI